MFQIARYGWTQVSLRRIGAWGPSFALLVLTLGGPAPTAAQQTAKIELKTISFTPGGFIPERFTCKGADVSPALTWTDPPAGTQSFAIIEDDPDAPSGVFVHWLIYGLPAASRRLSEGISGNDQMPDGSRQGTNDFSRTGYSGPCPPPGKPHRYFIRLYALDVKLDLRPAATRRELDAAMRGHLLAQAELMGRFRR